MIVSNNILNITFITLDIIMIHWCLLCVPTRPPNFKHDYQHAFAVGPTGTIPPGFNGKS